MDAVDIRTAWFFSSGARLSGAIFGLAGVFIATANIYLGLGCIIIGAFMVTSQYRLSIDLNRHTYFDYSWIFGMKFGETETFDEIEYIFVNKNKVSQAMSVMLYRSSRSGQTSFERYDYNGFLKFSDEKKIHLGSDADKQTIIAQMQYIAARLQCQVVDYSEE